MKKKMVEISKYYSKKSHKTNPDICYTDLSLIQDIQINDDEIDLYTENLCVSLTNTKETKEFLSQYFDFIEPKKETEK